MDPDRKKIVFEKWYKPMYEEYSKIISFLFDFDTKKNINGYQITLRKEINLDEFPGDLDDKKERTKRIKRFIECNDALLDKKYLPFRLSGDADYQVYDSKNNKKPEMHMLPNFSLIPVTGALNNIKGRRELSVFLDKSLLPYFEDRRVENLPYRKMGRKCSATEDIMELEKKVLMTFFDIFDSLDEYCQAMYFVDRKQITTPDDYWKIRKEKSEGHVDQSIIQTDIAKISDALG